MSDFRQARAVLEAALGARAFSAVSAEIGDGSRALWRYASGRLSFDESSAHVTDATIFDLASLTKVIATTTIALRQVGTGALTLDRLVREDVPGWSGMERTAVTVRDLLEHCSGLPAYREYFRTLGTPDAIVTAAAREPFEYAPRTRAVYSDVGFFVLGRVLEGRGGNTLDAQFDAWRTAAAIQHPLRYRPPQPWHERTACTEHDPWRGRVLQGEVHDENAAAMDGVAPHAGLFGTAAAVGEAARWWLRLLRGSDETAGVSTRAARAFAERSLVPGSSRAVGWDTMLTTSSCGTRMSPRAIGHTGFTGTSLWLDPERDLYFVLLTNRVHPTRTNDAIQPVRRAFHDAAADDLAHPAADPS